MKEFKGTPGPWHIRSRMVGSVGTDNQLVHICMNPTDPDLGMDEEDKYNTNLIAAAPDLLEALQVFAGEEVMAQLNGSEYVDPVDDEEWVKFRFVAKDYRKAASAIARALGEKQ